MANAKIRQEINIIDSQVSGISSTDTNAIVQLDTTQYSGTVTYYFEIVTQSAVTGVGSVTLRRSGTTTDDATITLNNNPSVRLRSASFTPPAGQTGYFVRLNRTSGLVGAESARIIVLQTDLTTGVTATETQIEIGADEAAKTNTASAALTDPKYWTYTAADWDGTKIFYAEVTSKTSAGNTHTVTLQEDNGSFASWVDKVTIVSAQTGTTATRRRSVAFTPTDGRHYRIAALDSTTKSTYTIYNGKIIVDQYDGFNPNVSATAYGVQGGTAGSSELSQQIAQSFKINATSTITAVTLTLAKVASPTDNLTVDIVSSLGGSSLATGSIAAASLTTSPVAYTISISSVSLTGGSTYYIQLSRTGTRDAVNYFAPYHTGDTYSDGTAQVRDNNSWTALTSGDLVFTLTGAKGVTKIEPQYLLLNKADIGTGLQSYFTLWDSSEWNDTQGGLPVFKYSHDATNAADSSKLRDITAAADVSGATVTGANQQISSAFTMPTTGDTLDTNVTVSTGNVGAVRILALYSVTAPPANTQKGNFFFFFDENNIG